MSSSAPLLSILVFSYNRGGFLAGTMSWLSSLLADDKYPNVEVVISDNTSADNTKEVAEKYMGRIPRCRYVRQPEHLYSGDVHALAGLDHTKGKYVWILSDDDAIDPGLFPQVLDYLETGKYHFFFVNPGIYSMGEGKITLPDGIVKPEDLRATSDIYEDSFLGLVKKLGLIDVMGSYSAIIVKREDILGVNRDEYFKICAVGALVPIAMAAFRDKPGAYYLKPAIINTIHPQRYENGAEGNVLIHLGYSCGETSRFFWTTLIARFMKKLIAEGVIDHEYFCSIVEVGLYGKYRLCHAVIHWCCEQLHEWINKSNQNERFDVEALREIRSLYDFAPDNFRYQWAFAEMEKLSTIIQGIVDFRGLPVGVFENNSWANEYFKASAINEVRDVSEQIRGIAGRKTSKIKQVIPWDQLVESNVIDSSCGYTFHRSGGFYYAIDNSMCEKNLYLLEGEEILPHVVSSRSLSDLRLRVRDIAGFSNIVTPLGEYEIDIRSGRLKATQVGAAHLIPEDRRKDEQIPRLIGAATLKDLKAKIAGLSFDKQAVARLGVETPIVAGNRDAAMHALFDAEYYRSQWKALATNEGPHGTPAALSAPLSHYLSDGRALGLKPHPLFDEPYYLSTYPSVADQVARGLWRCGFEHFACLGTFIGLSPSLYFDEGWVRARYLGDQALTAAPLNPSGFMWFHASPKSRGATPTPYFDERWYLGEYPEAAAEIKSGKARTPFEYFHLHGQFKEHSPSAEFDEKAYLNLQADVADAVANHAFRSGFEHYLRYGRFEGRRCKADGAA